MKVRDLNQYITHLCDGQETINLLGTDKELFLKAMNGKQKKLNSLVSGAASFASNAEEQLFYEFVQNAFDAKADSLFFYANKDYLIVLNNGEPFYTDLDIFDDDKEHRDGQLYNFLAKGQSLKLDDDTKLGKYGQGSKLLYTLLAEVNYNANTEDLLKEAIINNKKGPYLISWYDKSQLDALLINVNEWVPAQADDYESHLLFAKILMSYYPIAPGQNQEFFNDKEATDAIRAFEKLVDPRRNMHFLTRGTALIIPLGEGKYEAIVSKLNLENVRTRLGGFASITSDQDRNEGKKLEHIYVMGEEVEQHPVKSVFVEFQEGGRDFFYHFAFNPTFAEKGYVNFFKGLPILQTKFNLGFIVDSQVFEVDDSRQRINDQQKTEIQLVQAYKHLIIELEKIKDSSPEDFDYIYDSLLAYNYSSDDEKNFVRDSFYSVFRPFLLKYVRTSDGSYQPFESVYIPEERDGKVKFNNIPLNTIGIGGKFWFNPDVYSRYCRHFKGRNFNVLTLSDILSGADEDKLSAWIKSLPRDQYNSFHNLCVNTEGIPNDIKVFRSDKLNLYSYDDIYGEEDIYYSDEEHMNLFVAMEHICEPIVTEIQDNDYETLLKKINTNIEKYRCKSVLSETICEILKLISTEGDYVVEDICLLENWRNEYLPFYDLLSDTPDGTSLFDDFKIKGYIPDALSEVKWLASSSEMNLWNWTKRNFDKLKEVEGWGKNTKNYLADIRKVYSASIKAVNTTDKLYLYLDAEGKPIDTPCYTISNFDKLSASEYEDFTAAFPSINFVPGHYEKDLTNAPFSLETIHIDGLIKGLKDVDFATLRLIVKAYDGYESFMKKYHLIEASNKFSILEMASGGKNYFDNVPLELRKALVEANFYQVPFSAQALFNNENGFFDLKNNPDLIKKAIERIRDKILLFPVIKGCSEDVITLYFRKLGYINIDSKITEEDLRWQIIKFAANRTSETCDYKSILFEKIRHNSEGLPESIMDNMVCIEGRPYSIYDLDIEYKNDDKQIESFLECLPSDACADFFKDNYYSDRMDEVSIETLYEDLKNTYLTTEQLRFCLDYSFHMGGNYDNLEIEDSEADLASAMDMIKENQFIGFDRYFKIEDFDPDNQVFADKKWLTDEEQLPYPLQTWLGKNPEATNLFDSIWTEDNYEHIISRKAIYNNEVLLESYLPEFKNEDEAGIRTISWLLSQNTEYIYGQPAYVAITKIIERLPDDYSIIPFLRYTEKVFTKEGSEEISPIFKLEEYEIEGLFLSSYNWAKGPFLDLLKDRNEIKAFFKSSKVFLYNESDLLSRRKIKAERLDISIKVNKGDYQELSHPVYEIWKSMPESKGVKILLSNHPIGIQFIIHSSIRQYVTIGIADMDYGYETNKKVIIKYPNEDNLTPFKTIAKHISDIEFFKEPFIALQGLLVDQLEYLEKLADDKGVDINSLVDIAPQKSKEDQNTEQASKENETLKKISDNLNEEQLERLSKNIDTVNDVLENFSGEQLQQIQDKKNQILAALEDMAEEDESQESKVRQTIGFIGELIYARYLEKQGKDFVHAALEGIGEYDFHNKTDKTYVDVKTTIYSLKDGTAPFYLHRSQNIFMQKHPHDKYRIVRISLTDLSLKATYERLRDTYGPDANPLVDDRLRKECERIAKRYWGGAHIEEFDARSPEYSIKIEQKIKK